MVDVSTAIVIATDAQRMRVRLAMSPFRPCFVQGSICATSAVGSAIHVEDVPIGAAPWRMYRACDLGGEPSTWRNRRDK